MGGGGGEEASAIYADARVEPCHSKNTRTRILRSLSVDAGAGEMYPVLTDMRGHSVCVGLEAGMVS